MGSRKEDEVACLQTVHVPLPRVLDTLPETNNSRPSPRCLKWEFFTQQKKPLKRGSILLLIIYEEKESENLRFPSMSVHTVHWSNLPCLGFGIPARELRYHHYVSVESLPVSQVLATPREKMLSAKKCIAYILYKVNYH